MAFLTFWSIIYNIFFHNTIAKIIITKNTSDMLPSTMPDALGHSLVKIVKPHLVNKPGIMMKQSLFLKVTIWLDNGITGTYCVDWNWFSWCTCYPNLKLITYVVLYRLFRVT